MLTDTRILQSHQVYEQIIYKYLKGKAKFSLSQILAKF